jgi:hypothetical protein
MKWTYSIKNKLAASGALFSLCLLVLFSNYIDRDHTHNVKNAISTLYEDRLIAESYILKMTGIVYQIKETLNSKDAGANNTVNNLLLNFKKLNNAYLKTKFTEAEKSKADQLLNTMEKFESINLNFTENKLKTADSALALLNELSAIQLDESRQIMDHAEALYSEGKISSQFVFAIIIIILVVIQALVFTSNTLIPNQKTNSLHLN